MPLTKTSYSMTTGASINVLDYGADPTGVADSTSAISAALAAGQRIEFPPGLYKCNITITGTDGKHLVGQTQGQGGTTGVRIIPSDNTKPVIDVIGPAIDIIAENLFLDSRADGTYSRIGIGLRFKAASPEFVWRCAVRHVFIRGFQDGLVLDCDINASEIFDCDFQDIETIGCSRFSFKTRGVYNRFGKLFATQCGILGGTQPTADYAFYHDGSGCFFDSAVSDGRQYWGGTRNFVGIALIEAIYGPGHGGAGFPAMELSGTQFNIWQHVTLNGVPDSKYKVGIRIAGDNQTIGTAVIEGVNYPSTGFLFGTSSGVLTTAEAPGAKTPQPANWNFLGDVSGAIEGGGPQPLPWVFKSAWNGTSFIVDMGTYNLVLDPNTSPLASGTLTMPQANPPLDGQTLTISTTKTITSMEFKTTGIYFFYDGSQSITQTFSAGTSRSFIFRLSNYTWYPA